MFYFDPTYLLLIVPVLILGLIAQAAVQSRFNKYSQVKSQRGLTGAQAARQVLDTNNLQDVGVEETHGFLSDHYDPRSRTLRLSPQVAREPSVAAIGVAAHEAGHALQHATGYWPLQIRSSLVPAVQFGSSLGPLIILSGLALEWLVRGSKIGLNIAWIGVALYALVTVFALVTLPVELNATARAKKLIYEYDIVDKQELAGVSSVLSAAAWTYVVAALSAIVVLLRWVLILLAREERR